VIFCQPSGKESASPEATEEMIERICPIICLPDA